MSYGKYIRELVQADNSFLEELERANSGRNDIQPPVEFETGKLLSFFIRLINAKNVLEIGTANGYSTIWIASALKETGGKVTTIESKERLHLEAVKNIEKAELSNQTEFIFDDAQVAVKNLLSSKNEFDIIFQDCGKYLYSLMLQDTIDLCRKGGLIIADDTLFKTNDAVKNNLGKHTDQYNKAVFSRKNLFSTIIPIGHGLTVSFRKN
jgi:predicted O-methyltransferase YrrM